MTVTISRRLAALIGGFIAIVALVLTTAGACGSSNGNAAEHAAQSAGTTLLEQNQPLPIFKTSAYRYELIEVEAIQALGTPTTAFFFPEGTSVSGGHFSSPPIKTCPAQGEPIPNTASLSNPWQGEGVSGVAGAIAVGQMDPNGAYSPSASSGTYVLCLTPGGGTKLTYWEGPVFDESGTATWSDTQGIVDVGPSALPTCTVKTAQDGDGSGITAGTSYYRCTDTTGHAVNSGGA